MPTANAVKQQSGGEGKMNGARGTGDKERGRREWSAGGWGDGPAAGERRAVEQRRIGTASDLQKEGFDKGLIVILSP